MSFFTDFQDPDSQLRQQNAASTSTSTSITDHLDVVEEGFADSSEGDDLAAALADLRAVDSKDAGDARASAEAKDDIAHQAESKGWKEVAEGKGETKSVSAATDAANGIDDSRLEQIAGRATMHADDKITEVQKSNTTSTLYVRSTISVPDVDKILRSVSMLLHQMVQPAPEDDSTDFVLQLTATMEERIRGEHDDCGSGDGGWAVGGGDGSAAVHETVDNIFIFMKNAYTIAQWSPECNVLALVLLTRLVASTEMTFNVRNWDKLLLCSLLLAQKLWDDTPLANVDFPELWRQIFPGVASVVDLKLVNQMEKLFLQKLNYDIHVDRATYTRVYFELHALTDDKEQFALRPLADKEGRALEAHTRDLKSSLFSSCGKVGSGHLSPARDKGTKIGGSTIAVGDSSWDSRSQQSEAKGQGRVVLS